MDNLLPRELVSIPGVLDDGIVVAIVGDLINLSLATTLTAQTTTLTRKPSGSSAAIVSNAFTTDVTGYYQATVSAAGITRNILTVCFPASVLTQKVNALDPNSRVVSRTHLGSLVRDPRVSTTTMAAALEGAAAFTLPAILGGAFAGWTQFGPS